MQDNSYLPTAPDNIEKYSYVKRYAKLYSIFGLLAIICTVVALSIWASRSILFYPYYIYIFILFVYLGYTNSMGIFSNDFDLKRHKQIKTKFKYTNLPSVDVFLPSCGEDIEIIHNTYKYVSKLQWKGVMNIYVLDDKGSVEVEKLAYKYKFNYISRPNKGELKKAGNLRYAFARTSGDFIAIFDADFCPRPEYLKELMAYFNYDKKIAIVQTPQYFHRFKGQNSIHTGFMYKQELFYRLIQTSRDAWGGAVCVGTNAIYSREALTPMGGTAPMGHSEDMHTGYNLVSSGWKIKYIPLVMAKGTAPDNLASYYTQQYRWALGNLILITSAKFWLAPVHIALKMNYVASILYYVATSLGIVLNSIPTIIVLSWYPESVSLWTYLFMLPTILLTFVVQPLWSTMKWNLSANGVILASYYSSLFAIIDLIRGSQMPWVSTGDKKSANKVKSFQNYKKTIFLWSHFIFLSTISLAFMRMSSILDFYYYPLILFGVFYYLITMSIFEPFEIIKTAYKERKNQLSKSLQTVLLAHLKKL